MLPLWRFIPSGSRVLSVSAKSLNSGQLGRVFPVLTMPSGKLAISTIAVDMPDFQDSARWTQDEMRSVEGIQGNLADVSIAEARQVLTQAVEYQSEGPSLHGVQTDNCSYVGVSEDSYDARAPIFEGLNSHVFLNGCMQSNVPQTPNSSGINSGYASHLNMPGGGNKLLDKYTSYDRQRYHQSRHISTTSGKPVSIQGAQGIFIGEDELLEDPSPQGIQGDNCVRFKLWMENCQRYNLPNCDEQLQSIKLGRKTLAEVFMEQQEIIRLVAESYKNRHLSESNMNAENAQGVQTSVYNYSPESIHEVCPQGLQGDDCATYTIWAHNCRAFGFRDCDSNADAMRTGRRSLQDVFDEQDDLIRKIVDDFKMQRSTSAGSNSKDDHGNSEVGDSVGSSSSSSHAPSPGPQSPGPQPQGDGKLSQKDKLVRAVKDYGSTVIVFHIGISLVSLGGFYLAVSSGLDVVGLLQKIGVGESILQSRVVTGSTTFVMAYAVHKVFAPVRIATTLSCTPFIVRHLRKIGFLKTPKAKVD